jgi:hypothetical protein
MPDARFRGTDRERRSARSSPAIDRYSFGGIVQHCARAVSIEIINLLRLNPSAPACFLHDGLGRAALRMRLRQVMWISRCAVSGDLAENGGPPF